MTVAGDRLRDLLEDLRLPAVVVVEDAVSDECFVLCVARALGRERILVAKTKNWLGFAHAGGADRMQTFVTRERSRFRVVRRVAALLDSDRHAPHLRTKKHAYADKIRELECEIHVWEGREVENYVPSRVWREHYPHLKVKIGMLTTMTPAQRRCLDVKNGLEADLDKHPESAKLFQDLPPSVIAEWRTGIKGRRMPDPLVPDGMILTEQDFGELGPDAVDELRKVLDMIERIL